jgi:hypothetical protein
MPRPQVSLAVAGGLHALRGGPRDGCAAVHVVRRRERQAASDDVTAASPVLVVAGRQRGVLIFLDAVGGGRRTLTPPDTYLKGA